MEQHDKCVCRYLNHLPSNNVSRAASQQHTYQQKLVANLCCILLDIIFILLDIIYYIRIFIQDSRFRFSIRLWDENYVDRLKLINDVYLKIETYLYSML